MRNETRLRATQYIWTAFAVTMVVLLGTAGIFAGGLSASYVVLGVLICVAALGGTGMVWDKVGDDDAEEVMRSTEKVKRDRIDTVLRDLSSEDLQRLKERLQGGIIDDAILEERIVGIGDDGELITRLGKENRSDNL